MSNPIYNPVVPFTMGVSMQPGFMIYINGIPTGGRFFVNLKAGPDPQSDCVFHFNPRFDEGNVVVRNTQTGGHWGAEERNTNSPFPFVMGRQFEIILLCQANQYKVAVNGRHFVEYSHRSSYQSAKYLQVDGAVNLTMVRTDFETPKMPKVITNPSVPVTAIVPFNNIKNHKVTISGVPINHHPQRFHIDFRTAPEGNIFLHFNPRFTESQIVRNALLDRSWGGEERQLSVPFPFQYGIPYQLTFHVEQQRFRVQLNGMDICSFPHRRRPLTQIRQVAVAGCTTISRVEFV